MNAVALKRRHSNARDVRSETFRTTVRFRIHPRYARFVRVGCRDAKRVVECRIRSQIPKSKAEKRGRVPLASGIRTTTNAFNKCTRLGYEDANEPVVTDILETRRDGAKNLGAWTRHAKGKGVDDVW